MPLTQGVVLVACAVSPRSVGATPPSGPADAPAVGDAPEAPVAREAATSFEYETSAGCPTRDDFVRRITSRFRGEPTPRLVARLNALLGAVSVSGSEGTVVIRYRGEPASERTVKGQTCDEAATAAAVIVAIAIGLKVEDSRVPASPREGEATEPAARASAAPLTQSKTKQRPLAATVTVAAPSGSTPATDATRYQVDLGATAGMHTVLGPGPRPEFGALIELRSGPWSAGVTGAYSYASNEVEGRRARLSLWLARTEGCLNVLTTRWGWMMRACGQNDLGALGASGDEGSILAEGRSARVLWWAIGASAQVMGPDFYGGARLSADVGAVFAMIPYDFTLEEPHERVFRVPRAGACAKLHVTVPILELGR
jgi:hypothetical protein